LSLAVRVAGTDRTVIRYVESSWQLQVDRTSSGNISYDAAAGGVHTAIFEPEDDGTVNLHVLVDTCSVEVFVGQGQVVISDLIFPAATSDGLLLTTDGGSVELKEISVRSITL
jgi:levanase/fructan beta-fructosidase